MAFAHALPFLYAMGDTIMAWMLLWRVVVASEKLAAYKAPKIVEFRGELPKSAVGKILRKVLRDEDAAKKK